MPLKDGSPSAREIEMSGFRVAGYHGDQADYTRKLIARRRVKYADAQEQYRVGVSMRESGVKCECCRCKKQRQENQR